MMLLDFMVFGAPGNDSVSPSDLPAETEMLENLNIYVVIA